MGFTGSVTDLSFFYLDVNEFIMEEKRVIQHISKKLYIGNEEVMIKGELDNPKVITNSETQSVLEKWYNDAKHILEPLRDVKKKLYEDYKIGAFESRSYKDNLVIYRDLISQEKNAVTDFISKHKNSETAAYLLYYFYERLTMDTVQELYDTLGETIKQNKYNEAIEIYLTTKVLEIGDNWKDFTAFNTDGDTILLSEVEQSTNKHMLLVFSRRGCIPCEKAIPELKDIYKKYHEELRLVSYYQDITAEELKSKAENDEIEWTYLGTNKSSDRRTSRLYDAAAVPKFVLISPERKLIYSWKKGYEKGALTEKLEEYLGS